MLIRFLLGFAIGALIVGLIAIAPTKHPAGPDNPNFQGWHGDR